MTYYKISKGGYYTLVNDTLRSLGDFEDVSYDDKANIIKGQDKDGKVYNVLTHELITIIKKPSIGDILEGQITGIKPYGIFIGFSSGHSGLVHISNIVNTNKSISDFRRGQSIKVRIKKIKSKTEFNLELVTE